MFPFFSVGNGLNKNYININFLTAPQSQENPTKVFVFSVVSFPDNCLERAK